MLQAGSVEKKEEQALVGKVVFLRKNSTFLEKSSHVCILKTVTLFILTYSFEKNKTRYEQPSEFLLLVRG